MKIAAYYCWSVENLTSFNTTVLFRGGHDQSVIVDEAEVHGQKVAFFQLMK